MHEVDLASLNKRGWVLQEHILSPRVIHFAKKQVFWEWRQLSACKSFPSGAFPDAYLMEDNDSLKTLVRGETEKEYRDRSGNTPAHYWDKVITTYATCDLTFRTDKLISLSGIALKVQAMIQSDYLAGLWSSHIPYNLMWQPNYYRSFNRSPEYVAPVTVYGVRTSQVPRGGEMSLPHKPSQHLRGAGRRLIEHSSGFVIARQRTRSRI
jgi:hypothetical protein